MKKDLIVTAWLTVAIFGGTFLYHTFKPAPAALTQTQRHAQMQVEMLRDVIDANCAGYEYQLVPKVGEPCELWLQAIVKLRSEHKLWDERS